MGEKLKNAKIIFESTLQAFIEVSFSLLPVGLYTLTLILTGNDEGVSKLPGWAFAAFSMYSLMTLDTINAFRHRDKDKGNRKASAIVAIVGLGVSAVLMTLSIVRSQNDSFELPDFFDTFVLITIGAGYFFAVIIKSILIQRDDHGRIV
jgi:hypothetical protein